VISVRPPAAGSESLSGCDRLTSRAPITLAERLRSGAGVADVTYEAVLMVAAGRMGRGAMAAADLFGTADAALYRAKELGRDMCVGVGDRAR
jgi:GGDEF domain-containing protein